MDLFTEILLDSSKSSDKDVVFSQKEAQALYRLIREYFDKNKEASNEDCYGFLSDFFYEINREITLLPSIKSDTIRYNTAVELSGNRELLKESYEKVIRSEERSEIPQNLDGIAYNTNAASARRSLMIQMISGLRYLQEECKENKEMIRKISELNSKERKQVFTGISTGTKRNIEDLKKIFQGNELLEVTDFLKECIPSFYEAIKKDYISEMVFLGENFKKLGLLEKYNMQNDKTLEILGLEDLRYEDEEVENVFSEDYLKTLDITTLSVLDAFWINRYIKEIDSMNKAFFFVSQLGLWDQIKEEEPDLNFGEINLDINPETLENIYQKMYFLQNIVDRIYDFLQKNEDIGEIKTDEIKPTKKFKEVNIRNFIDKMQAEIGSQYEKYFENLMPDLEHSFDKDFDEVKVMGNAKRTGYSIKDYHMIAMLSNLYSHNHIKNWGIILEEGKDFKTQKMVLIRSRFARI